MVGVGVIVTKTVKKTLPWGSYGERVVGTRGDVEGGRG